MTAVLSDDRIHHLRGRVAHAGPRAADPVDPVHPPGRREPGNGDGFDLVIRGFGADPLWFTALFSQDALDLIELGLGGPMTADSLQEAIGYDLAVTDVARELFLPNLSGRTRGPGFPT